MKRKVTYFLAVLIPAIAAILSIHEFVFSKSKSVEPVVVQPMPDVQPDRVVSVPAERYTNIQQTGSMVFIDYLLANYHPDGSYDIIQSKTRGLNLIIPIEMLRKIDGK